MSDQREQAEPTADERRQRFELPDAETGSQDVVGISLFFATAMPHSIA